LTAIEHWYPNSLSVPKAESKEELFKLLQLAIGEEASKYVDFYQISEHQDEIPRTEETSVCETDPTVNHPNNEDADESSVQEAWELFRSCCSRFKGSDTLEALRHMMRLHKLRDGRKANFLGSLHDFGKDFGILGFPQRNEPELAP